MIVQVLLLYKKEGDYMENLVPKVLAVEQHKGKFRTIYVDNKCRKCVWNGDGYYLLKKDGTIGKRKTKEY